MSRSYYAAQRRFRGAHRDAFKSHKVTGYEVLARIEIASTFDLTDWEQSFIESLRKHFKKNRSISEAQDDILKRIEAAGTSPTKVADPILVRIEKVAREKDLSSWEQSFIESINKQGARKALSERQHKLFYKIEERYSPEAKAAETSFRDSFDTRKKESWKVVINYYRKTGSYYAREVAKTINDPDYIPSAIEYERVCNNKYSKRIIAAHFDPPKYEINTLVQFRANAARNRSSLGFRHHDGWLNYGLFSKIKDDLFVVINNGTDEPIVSAAKGAKVYIVLPLGKADVYRIEERFLKKAKGLP